MSVIVYEQLGGGTFLASPRLGQLVSPVVDATIGEKLEEQYYALRDACIEKFGLQFCNSVLPAGVYNAMGRRKISVPWWGWMILGLLLGRILRI